MNRNQHLSSKPRFYYIEDDDVFEGLTREDIEAVYDSQRTCVRDNDMIPLFEKLAQQNNSHLDKFKEEKGQFTTCEFCSNQKILKKNERSHINLHKKSIFIANKMWMLYRTCANPNLIFCEGCFEKRKKSMPIQQNRLASTFDQTTVLKHLCEYHPEELKFNENELLRQIGFFSDVETKNLMKNHSLIVNYKFTYEQMLEFIQLYFSNREEDFIKRDQLLGKMYFQLSYDCQRRKIDFNVSTEIRSLMDKHVQMKKNENLFKEPKNLAQKNISGTKIHIKTVNRQEEGKREKNKPRLRSYPQDDQIEEDSFQKEFEYKIKNAILNDKNKFPFLPPYLQKYLNTSISQEKTSKGVPSPFSQNFKGFPSSNENGINFKRHMPFL